MRRLLVVAALVGCSSNEPQPSPARDAAPSAPATCTRKPRVTEVPKTCNGAEALCEKRFDQVTFAMTHNAMSNAADRWAAPNQNHGIARQLKDGVRGMMLDTHYYDAETDKTLDARLPGVAAVDQVHLCHGVCQLGNRRLLDGLCDVVDFLDANRGEILTILFESHVSAKDMVDVLAASGATDYVWAHSGAFPTLREMIDSNRRLVIFAESGGGEPAWYHAAWKLIWDTPYSFSKASEFSCKLNRGDERNPLFLMNHWILDPIANPKRAAEVNARDVLLARAKECALAAGRNPSFLGVDFYDLGDVLAVARELNGL